MIGHLNNERVEWGAGGIDGKVAIGEESRLGHLQRGSVKEL